MLWLLYTWASQKSTLTMIVTWCSLDSSDVFGKGIFTINGKWQKNKRKCMRYMPHRGRTILCLFREWSKQPTCIRGTEEKKNNRKRTQTKRWQPNNCLYVTNEDPHFLFFFIIVPIIIVVVGINIIDGINTDRQKRTQDADADADADAEVWA